MKHFRFFFSNGKQRFRSFYASLLCPQTCLLCGQQCRTGLPLCKRCIDTEFICSINSRNSRTEAVAYYNTERCRRCGKILISEQEYCTRCRMEYVEGIADASSACDRIFTLFPYIGLGQRLVPAWKNNSIRSFSSVFAPLVFRFLMQNPELLGIPLVPVPPRPQKLREKGWDQIEDLVKALTVFPQITVKRCLQRRDGTAQKKLSRDERAVNLQGKISVSAKTVPDTLILLDDVMTTGATLEACAAALKQAGCKHVLGLCLFFD